MGTLLPRPNLPIGPRRINNNPTVVDSGMNIRLPEGYNNQSIRVNSNQYNLPGSTDVMLSRAVDAYAVPPHHGQHIDFRADNQRLADGYILDQNLDNLINEVRGMPNESPNTLRQVLQPVADFDEWVQSKLRVPEENYHTKPGGWVGSVNRTIRGPLHSGNPWSNAPEQQFNSKYEGNTAGWAMTGLTRVVQGAGATAAGMGLHALTGQMLNTFGGAADQQEPNQLRI